jgi:hypothetical protein
VSERRVTNIASDVLLFFEMGFLWWTDGFDLGDLTLFELVDMWFCGKTGIGTGTVVRICVLWTLTT